MNNPYLEEYNKLSHNLFDRNSPRGPNIQYPNQAAAERGTSYFDVRRRLVKKYAWAVPNEEAISELAKHSPLVEIGAGNGYWASLVRQAGGEIYCYDDWSWDERYTDDSRAVRRETYTDVYLGDDTALDKHPDCTLFLCWPPYNEPLAFNCLSRYQTIRKTAGFAQNKLIYVGEGQGGCNGDESFWTLLEGFREIKAIEIPQFWGIHDYFLIFESQA